MPKVNTIISTSVLMKQMKKVFKDVCHLLHIINRQCSIKRPLLKEVIVQNSPAEFFFDFLVIDLCLKIYGDY